jgi:poly(hydroxyalkanoate) granule-associated protein
MPKKNTEKSNKGKKKQPKIPVELRESANRIWLAGLGALSMAEEEGGKLFKSLVERGETLESRGKKQVKKVQEKLGDRVDQARDKAGSTWSRFEELVDEKVAATLQKVGVPARDEIQRLTERVEQLTRKVDQLKPPVEKAPKARKATPRKAKATAKTA